MEELQCYEMLGAAVVELAITDYMNLTKQLYRARRGSANYNSIKGKIADIKRFFRSKRFTVLCDLNGEELINKLDNMFEEWKLTQAKT